MKPTTFSKKILCRFNVNSLANFDSISADRFSRQLAEIRSPKQQFFAPDGSEFVTDSNFVYRKSTTFNSCIGKCAWFLDGKIYNKQTPAYGCCKLTDFKQIAVEKAHEIGVSAEGIQGMEEAIAEGSYNLYSKEELVALLKKKTPRDGAIVKEVHSMAELDSRRKCMLIFFDGAYTRLYIRSSMSAVFVKVLTHILMEEVFALLEGGDIIMPADLMALDENLVANFV